MKNSLSTTTLLAVIKDKQPINQQQLVHEFRCSSIELQPLIEFLLEKNRIELKPLITGCKTPCHTCPHPMKESHMFYQLHEYS